MPDDGDRTPTLYEWAGGGEAIERLINSFYDRVEADDLISPFFPGGVSAEHRDHVVAWWSEVFGGPDRYTRELGGYENMLARHRGLGIALLHLGGETKPRQQAIAVGTVRHEIGKRRLGFAVLVLLGQFDRLVEGIARLGRLLGLEILIAAPATDGGDDQERHSDDKDRVLVPELLELLAADFLVYFIK